MKHAVNAMKIAARMANQPQIVRVGTITAYDDTGTGSVKVMIQPDAGETGWIPLLSPWIGNGWGMVCAPSIGDPVEVHFELGSTTAGFAGLRFFNDSQRAPPAPSGEFWLIHKSGSLLKFTNDGKVALISTSDLNATVGGNLNATVAGEINANAASASVTTTGNAIVQVGGNLTATVTGTAMITAAAAQIVSASIQLCAALTDALLGLCTSAFATWSAGHVHSISGGTTGTPTTAPPSNAVTSVLTAE